MRASDESSVRSLRPLAFRYILAICLPASLGMRKCNCFVDTWFALHACNRAALIGRSRKNCCAWETCISLWKYFRKSLQAARPIIVFIFLFLPFPSSPYRNYINPLISSISSSKLHLLLLQHHQHPKRKHE